MTDRQWKALERQTAKLMGGVRHPSAGVQAADITAGAFSIEHKARKSLPQWLSHAIDQAAAAGLQNANTGICVLTHYQGRGRKPRRYVLLTFEDWQAWHGREDA